MATIGSLAVNIIARTDKLNKGLGKSQKAITKFAASAGAAAAKVAKFGAAATAAGAGLATVFVRQQFAAIDSIGKMSERLGIATEQLSGLHHAAGMAGIGTNTLDMALQRMARRTSEAARGSGEAVGALQELGLSARTLSQLSPDRQLGRVADALNRVQGQSDRIRLAFKLFDSEGVALLNLTQEGSEGIAAMVAEAERLGLTFDKAGFEKIKAANDAVTRLKSAFTGVWRTAAIQIAPAVERVAKWISTSMERAGTLQSIFRGIGNTFHSIRNFVDQIRVLFIKTQVGFNKIIIAMGDGLNSLAQKTIEFINKIPGVDLQSGGLNMAFNEELRRTNERLIKNIGKIQSEMQRRAENRLGASPTARGENTLFRDAAAGAFAGIGATIRQISGMTQQIGALGGLVTGKQPGGPVRPGMNAALEAGTREAFMAQRGGGRQELQRKMNKLMERDVKANEDVSKKMSALIESMKAGAGKVFSIPNA